MAENWVRREDVVKTLMTSHLQELYLTAEGACQHTGTPLEEAQAQALGQWLLIKLVLFPDSDFCKQVRFLFDRDIRDPAARALFALPQDGVPLPVPPQGVPLPPMAARRSSDRWRSK